jgi:hypothetical protein
MPNTKLRSTLAAIVAALAIVGPQLLNLLADWKSPKAAIVISALGFVVALATSGKAVALINLFLPAPTDDAAAKAQEIVNNATKEPK